MNNKCCESIKNCSSSEPKHVETVSTNLSMTDIIGGWKARWGIGRMKYIINPGLYAVGNPNNESPVLVSANYKLTFDTLRKNLKGLNCWILILDTKGINVWCSAGKGTFCAEEIVKRIESSELSNYVSHKKLILPQLSAPGVNAHKVKSSSGYSVNYGTVRAEDIKEYIRAGNIATKEMKTVQFNLWDRLVLTPMELLPALKKALPIFGIMLLSNTFLRKPFDGKDVLSLTSSIVSGAVITPAFLPYIPGNAFAIKGWLVGLGITAGVLGMTGRFNKENSLLTLGHLILFPAISSFLAMNFTGSSTYTSPTGTLKEVKKAIPIIIGSVVIGGIITLAVHLLDKRSTNEA